MARGSKTKTAKQQEAAIKVVQEKSLDLTEDVDRYDSKNPRQALFLQLYFDHRSPTWGNAKQSAIAAGFSEEYADVITYQQPKWFSDFIGQQDIASLIEKHVAEVLNLPTVTQAMGAFGPITTTETIKVEKTFKNGKTRLVNKKIKVPVYVPNINVIKEKTAVMKIAAPAHNPEKYGKKTGGNNNFFFDMRQTKERYTWNTVCL